MVAVLTLTAVRVCAGALVAAAALAGCSTHGRHVASVATSFGQESGVSAVVSPGHESATPTPCAVASPQIFVEGKQAATQGGQVMFSYLDATRICSGDENSRYVTTGKTLTTKPVSPAAVVLLLAPGGGAGELQVPPAALPAAMATSKVGPPYYTITVDGTGTVTRIEQAYLP